MAEAGDRRFLVFLALSIALHALWLAVPLRTKVAGAAAVPLSVQLAPLTPAEKSAVVVRPLPPGRSATSAHQTSLGAEPPIDAAPSLPPAIDLDAAFATARSVAKDRPAAAPVTPSQTTMATAVAGALRNHETIETRGANGEYVTISGKTRCVTPLLVPHFLEGKTMLTLCETRKG